MNYFKIIASILCISMITLSSCKDKTKPATSQDTEATTKTSEAPEKKKITAANFFHYICSSGCINGAAVAGNCSNCGSVLEHNQAYHNNTNNSTTHSTPNTNTPTTTLPITTPTTTQKTEPSQNANGVWHYTCNNGCAGGAGAAGNCSNCGNALAHNSAYHQ